TTRAVQQPERADQNTNDIGRYGSNSCDRYRKSIDKSISRSTVKMGLTTFSTGLSGLATNSQALNVVGNNLANLNTVGYKTSDISFTDILGQTFSTPGTAKSGNTMEIGLGAQVGAVRQLFTQGSLQTTNNPLDVAIQGKGFLVVKNGQGQFYTRAGNLHLDADGNLVTSSGALVQGYTRNAATGPIDSNLGLTTIKMRSGLDSPVSHSQHEIAR